MAIYAYLFDAEAQDRQVKFDEPTLESVGTSQLLWVDVNGFEPEEFQRVSELLSLSATMRLAMQDGDGFLHQGIRPRLDQYGDCFHLNVEAVQTREQTDGAIETDKSILSQKVLPSHTLSTASATTFRLVTVHFVVFANLVLSLHEHPAAFLDSFDKRIKGDTNLGSLDGPAFLGALLNWHVTGYFRALEVLETEVDRIDDAALRQKRGTEERDLLLDMVKVRRRLALVRRTLLPHREVYATLARPRFASFVTEEATTRFSAWRIDSSGLSRRRNMPAS